MFRPTYEHAPPLFFQSSCLCRTQTHALARKATRESSKDRHFLSKLKKLDSAVSQQCLIFQGFRMNCYITCHSIGHLTVPGIASSFPRNNILFVIPSVQCKSIWKWFGITWTIKSHQRFKKTCPSFVYNDFLHLVPRAAGYEDCHNDACTVQIYHYTTGSHCSFQKISSFLMQSRFSFQIFNCIL